MSSREAAGRLITLEGGEGCGKSTQARLLAERLRSAGLKVLETREPGGTPLGERLRDLLKTDPAGAGMAPETEVFLLNASRAELVRKVLRPALAAGEMVVCDRFYDSTLAYQGGGRGLDRAALRAAIEMAVGGLHPDITLLLRVEAATARDRVARRTSSAPLADRFDSERDDFFRRVTAEFDRLAAAEPGRFTVVDANGDRASVAAAIWAAVSARLGLQPEAAG